jgi:hypothetical protein
MAYHCCTQDLRTFAVSQDIARALTGSLSGRVYRVALHALPGRVFDVEATTVDHAQAVVVACVKKERPSIASGATVQLLTD